MLAKTSYAALTGFLLLGASPVWAQNIDSQEEATAFAERLKAVAAEQGIPIAFDGATISGADVTLTGFRFDQPAADPAAAQQKIDVTFKEVSGSTEEGWRAESVPFADIDETTDGTRGQVKGMAITGLELAGTQPSDPVPEVKKLSPLFFESAAIQSVNIEEGGKPVFSLSDAKIDNTINDDGSFSSAFNFGTFNADFASAPADEEGIKTLREIGYEKLAGSISGQADWNPQTGVLSLDPFDINVADAGNLSFTYAISGYTPAFIESMKQTQAQMAANPQDNSAAGMAMMGLISQLYLDSAVLSFEDASLTNKLLDYFAKQNDADRATFVAQLGQMVPAMLASLNNPEFQTKVETAVSTFLQDPKSLRIAIEPANPVPATQIIGAAMGAPQTLPNVLQLDVTANQAGGN
ncbi:hypothetical protein [Antarcticirhabdus aurantiaca]|uniref:Uncharacterized protein n=1 Tax=Antarcticirhabdus aurantiaca TaxID=2606717 RepID=A0ACD4NHZ6_9HYPH|nr:hypothetical protein [Antarcticirhabdus aurantiaca]WAJ26457.1 hypothetical protein OXU80_16405 [Jeongeuplla avenae]